MSERTGSMVIEAVEPELDGGRYAVKRVAGETVSVQADVFKEGHDILAVVLRWRQLTPAVSAQREWNETPMHSIGNDRFAAEFPLEEIGRYAFTIEAWPDAFRTWVSELERKLAAERPVASELIEGAALLHQAALRAPPQSEHSRHLLEGEKALLSKTLEVAIAAALEPALRDLASKYPDRSNATRYDRELPVYADRRRAIFGAWYEFFPRSAGREGKHGTFADAEALLPYIEALGLDVIYFPPIHPIGHTGRKGPNNISSTNTADLGSPWAIGSREGGHKSVHPALGTLQDFSRLLESARKRGLEVALDLAFQLSPDHPYIEEHPEWFSWRPDGTLKTAENPPKRYEDIVNFDFLGPARESLWAELKSIVLFWIEAGVRIFRVDNPHTKPFPFWAWLIRQVQDVHPDVLFLAEAFTRPKVMKALAKAGFTQSYTYFTWRVFKREIQEYLEELTQSSVAEYMRGNLWPNTPDILSDFLQQGGPPAFKIRLALAATLSPSYGIYSGYEWCEARAIAGTEEYLDSEKYQLRPMDPERPGNIRAYLARINQIRRSNPSLQLYANLRFYQADNEQVLFYGKKCPDGSNPLLIAVSLDPFSPQQVRLHVPLGDLGLNAEETYQVHELMQDRRMLWRGPEAQVTLTPDEPAAVWSVHRFAIRENSFDYYY
jgi:starch synthase (maltosyl-transferring)